MATVLFSPGSSHQHPSQCCSHNFKQDILKKRTALKWLSITQMDPIKYIQTLQLSLSPLLTPVACNKGTVCPAHLHWSYWGEVLSRPLNVSAWVSYGLLTLGKIKFGVFLNKEYRKKNPTEPELSDSMQAGKHRTMHQFIDSYTMHGLVQNKHVKTR